MMLVIDGMDFEKDDRGEWSSPWVDRNTTTLEDLFLTEIESHRATISRLREYARHKPGCWWLRGPNCDCGYDALMAELEGSK